MLPIKVGLIGLSAGTAFNWAAKAHLPYLRSTAHYIIVALANSSVKSAKAAIE
jgi:predicted dehydrogenase